MTPLHQRKVTSFGATRKEKLPLFATTVPPSLPPPPTPSFSLSHTGSHVYNVKLFPEDPVELLVGETLTMNCTALVEFDTGVDFRWSYPGSPVGATVVRQTNINSDIVKIGIFLQLISFPPRSDKQLGRHKDPSGSSVTSHRGREHLEYPQSQCHGHWHLLLQCHQHWHQAQPANTSHCVR